ncbi:MAG: MBL fold metallo-hydrolase [Steroidobacteraceae bacterium]
MQSRVTEIASDTYQITAFHPEFGFQFNQFLVLDDEPFLMHTGTRRMFETTLAGVASLMDPSTLRWIGFSHFEADECGALNSWLRTAQRAQPVCGELGAVININDFADRAPRSLADNEVLRTGKHRLRYLATPHVPHGWDAGLFVDDSGRTLFCSDLFFHPGDPEPLNESDIVGRARDSILSHLTGPFSHDLPYTPLTDGTLRRLAALEVRTLAVMHGSSYRGDAGKCMLELAAVLNEALSLR